MITFNEWYYTNRAREKVSGLNLYDLISTVAIMANNGGGGGVIIGCEHTAATGKKDHCLLGLAQLRRDISFLLPSAIR